MKRLLITGAAGTLGKLARARLGHMADVLRLSDIADMDPAGDGEEVVPCDLADAAAVDDLVQGATAFCIWAAFPSNGPGTRSSAATSPASITCTRPHAPTATPVSSLPRRTTPSAITVRIRC